VCVVRCVLCVVRECAAAGCMRSAPVGTARHQTPRPAPTRNRHTHTHANASLNSGSANTGRACSRRLAAEPCAPGPPPPGPPPPPTHTHASRPPAPSPFVTVLTAPFVPFTVLSTAPVTLPVALLMPSEILSNGLAYAAVCAWWGAQVCGSAAGVSTRLPAWAAAPAAAAAAAAAAGGLR
jgi:hypothetical protein